MVSVVIVNFNTYTFTEKCIISIIEKTKETEYEIIVVSNSSSDKDIKKLNIRFPEVNIYENELPAWKKFRPGCSRSISQTI